MDLAGSERLNEKENKKAHIGETGYINKSLFMLTNVINKLADNSSYLNKKVYIPYRDSKLTRLLSQSLGGNSLTTIICTISPASMNYYQTLSTLRFAMRAKSVRLQATTNEYFDDKDRIYYYQKEIKKLKDQLRNRDNKMNYNINNNINMNYNEESFGQVSQYEYNKIVNAYQNLNEELENYKQLYLKEKRKSERYKAQINGNTNFNMEEESEDEEDEDEEEEEDDDEEEKEIIDNNNISAIITTRYQPIQTDFKSYNNFKLFKKENNNGGTKSIFNLINSQGNRKINRNIPKKNDKDEYEQLKNYIIINRNKSYKNDLSLKRINSYDAFKRLRKEKPIKTETNEKENLNNYSQYINPKNYNNIIINKNKNIIKYSKKNNDNKINNYTMTEYDTIEKSEKNINKKLGYITTRNKNKNDYDKEKNEKEINGNENIKNNISYDKNEETINAIIKGNVFNMLDINYNEIIYNNKNPKQLEILKKLYAFKMDALEKTMDYYHSFLNEYYKNKIIEINNIQGFSEPIQNKKRTLLNNTTNEFNSILNKLKDLYRDKKEELEYKFNMFLKNFSN